MLFNGSVTEGKLKVNRMDALKEYVSKLKEGTKLSLEVKVQRKYRSLPQNKLYWFWLGLIGESTGYDPEELHDTYKSMFLVDRSLSLPLVRSTKKLDTLQFGQYLDKVKMHAQDELGIILPEPDEAYA